MKKKLLGLTLSLVTAAVLLGSGVLAFYQSGWNYQEVVMPLEENIEEIRNRISELKGKGEFNLIGQEIKAQSGEILFNVEFSSPLRENIYIEDISGDIYLGENDVGNLHLPEDEVVIEGNETNSFVLKGSLSEDVNTSDFYLGEMSRAEVRNVSTKLEVFGLEFRVEGLGDIR
ncbi:MAG: hypothetical protein ACLFTQ_03845 [Candidatus Aenigmatarchaeota archaeon]